MISIAADGLDVLTCGEAMVLFVARECGPLEQVGAFDRAAAGAELNVATGLARLGLRAGYLTRLGDDCFGRYLAGCLRREGIVGIATAPDAAHPTGFMLKGRRDDGGDPDIEYHRRGSAASHLGLSDLTTHCVDRARCVHLTGITPALSASTRELVFEIARRAREAGRLVVFDPNLRPRLWPSQAEMVACINDLAGLADIVLPGLAEGRLLTGRDDPAAIADFYRARGARGVAVKLGARGALCVDASGAIAVDGVLAPRVVDTVGAGDGFAVGVISGLLEGLTLPHAARRGCVIGARVVQFPGDSDGLPTRAQLADELARAESIADRAALQDRP